MFLKNYRSDHEHGVGEINPMAVDFRMGKISSEELKAALLRRDRYAWLEMDASHPHVHYLEFLLEINPDAKYILTFREPVAWLNSVFNQHLHKEKRPYFDVLHNYRYQQLCPANHSENDIFLRDKYTLYPLESYLKYWNYHILRVLNLVPTQQLLVISTENLSKSASKLADFLNLPQNTIDTLQSHSYKATKKDGIVDLFEPEFLDGLLNKHCHELYSKLLEMETRY
jgi:hypothetical protein